MRSSSCWPTSPPIAARPSCSSRTNLGYAAWADRVVSMRDGRIVSVAVAPDAEETGVPAGVDDRRSEEGCHRCGSLAFRLATRLARREVRRRPGRTLLVALLVAMPVAGMLVADVALRTNSETPLQIWRSQNGMADAVVFPGPPVAETLRTVPADKRICADQVHRSVVGRALSRAGYSDGRSFAVTPTSRIMAMDLITPRGSVQTSRRASARRAATRLLCDGRCGEVVGARSSGADFAPRTPESTHVHGDGHGRVRQRLGSRRTGRSPNRRADTREAIQQPAGEPCSIPLQLVGGLPSWKRFSNTFHHGLRWRSACASPATVALSSLGWAAAG